jgi:hypothetical protein
VLLYRPYHFPGHVFLRHWLLYKHKAGRHCLGDDRGVYKLVPNCFCVSTWRLLAAPLIVLLPSATRLICSDRLACQPSCLLAYSFLPRQKKNKWWHPFGICSVRFPSTPLERESAIDGKGAHPPTEVNTTCSTTRHIWEPCVSNCRSKRKTDADTVTHISASWLQHDRVSCQMFCVCGTDPARVLERSTLRIRSTWSY